MVFFLQEQEGIKMSGKEWERIELGGKEWNLYQGVGRREIDIKVWEGEGKNRKNQKGVRENEQKQERAIFIF